MQKETDVLIVGAGAAGLTACIAAREEGADVIVIEKADRLGGTAAVSGGIVWVPDNSHMAAAGIADSAEDALAYFRSLNHGDIDEELLCAFVHEGAGTVDFLEHAGAAKFSLFEGYPDYYLDRPGAKPGGGRALDNELFAFSELGPWAEKVYGHGEPPRLMLRETPLGGASGMIDPDELQNRIASDSRGWGQALIGRLLKACLERDVEPILGTSIVRLICEDGIARAAEIECGAERSVIHARRGIVLATGGFEWNEDLRQTFLRGPVTAPASPPTNQGDGLKVAMAAGAKLGNMTSAWWMPTLSIPGDVWNDGSQRAVPVLIERTLPHTILVNRQGKRFCNEANNYCSLAGAFHFFDPETYDYANLPAYLIFDHQFKSQYPLATVMPWDETPNWVYQADSLSALADILGVDGTQLEATVEDFNANAERGVDPAFRRGESPYDRFYGDRSRDGTSATLGPLTKPPYYAVEIKMGALGTNGGPKTDASARVQSVDGAVIPGLFAAGNVTAAPTGGVYAGAGGTLGPALTFGFIAGREAARGVSAASYRNREMGGIKTVLVIGATGDQGHPLLRKLIDAGFEPVAALRNPNAFAGTEFEGIRTVQAELNDMQSMIAAAHGMDAIAAHLPFTFDRTEAGRFGATIAAAARATGLKKIVFNTSCYVHDEDIGITGHDGRRDIERAIVNSGVPYAIFEPKVFMDNITRVWCKPGIVNNNIFGYPAGPTLKICWICLDDVAAFMVEALKRPDAPSGRFPIGGPEALTGAQAAERISAAAGREITFNSLSPDDFASAMSLLVTGSPDVKPGSIYERMADFYRWYNAQPVSPLVVDLKGVLSIFPIRPTPFSEWAARQDWSDPNDPALAIRLAGVRQ